MQVIDSGRCDSWIAKRNHAELEDSTKVTVSPAVSILSLANMANILIAPEFEATLTKEANGIELSQCILRIAKAYLGLHCSSKPIIHNLRI